MVKAMPSPLKIRHCVVSIIYYIPQKYNVGDHEVHVHQNRYFKQENEEWDFAGRNKYGVKNINVPSRVKHTSVNKGEVDHFVDDFRYLTFYRWNEDLQVLNSKQDEK